MASPGRSERDGTHEDERGARDPQRALAPRTGLAEPQDAPGRDQDDGRLTERRDDRQRCPRQRGQDEGVGAERREPADDRGSPVDSLQRPAVYATPESVDDQQRERSDGPQQGGV